MDPRRLLSGRPLRLAATAALLGLSLSGCAVARLWTPAPTLAPALRVAPAPAATPPPLATVAPSPPLRLSGTERPYLEPMRSSPPSGPTPSAQPPDRAVHAPAAGRPAIAVANRAARAEARPDGFVGGVQVFAWAPGRVYEVWTAPLRVTLLTLAPGETIVAKAAGDTVRWQIGDSVSGAGPAARAHVLIKPLETGLETNLVLTTSQRVYLVTLKSGAADAFNAAVAWDFGAVSTPPAGPAERRAPPLDLAVVAPQAPLDAGYRIEPRGRAPRWTPTTVATDGVRTFITLAPEAAADETPVLFVETEGGSELVNYRQSGPLLVVDRVLERAELRVGDRRPRVVLIRRNPGDRR